MRQTTGTAAVMTTERPRSNARDSAAGAMLRGAVLPSIAVSAVCVGVATWAVGESGLWGSLLGAGLVLVFFSMSLVALGATARLDPTLTLLIALALYTAKIIALAVAFVVLNGAGLMGDPFDRTALGVTVIVCTLVWTILEIVASVKHREPLYDLGDKP